MIFLSLPPLHSQLIPLSQVVLLRLLKILQEQQLEATWVDVSTKLLREMPIGKEAAWFSLLVKELVKVDQIHPGIPWFGNTWILPWMFMIHGWNMLVYQWVYDT